MAGPLNRAPRLPLLFGAGAVLAVVAVVAAPGSPQLPSPDTPGQQVLAAAALATIFAVGCAAPLPSLLALVPIAVVEGAVRRWIVNDISVFMLKDFLVLGVYAATLPRLTHAELRRPWWLLAPLALVVALALVHMPLTDDREQAVIGLRSYVLYLPLLWVAPKLLQPASRALLVLYLVIVVAAAEAVLGALQTVTADDFLNKLTLNTLPAFVTHGETVYLRPTGTFLQVGTFAAFFFFAVIAVLAVAATAPRGRLLWTAIACAVPITWGVALGASRALTWTAVVAVAAFGALTLVQKHWLAAGAIVVAAVAGWFSLQHLPLGGGSGGTKVITFTYLGDNGKTVTRHATIGTGGSGAVQGLVEKGTRASATDKVSGGVPHNRLREQWAILKMPRLVGHGTGSMTLGSSYVLPKGRRLLWGEGMFSKLTWELGTLGLLAFAAFLLAAFVACARAAWTSRGADRTAALAAAGVAGILPLWFVLTFALDYPVAAALYYTLVGYAVAQRPANGR